MRNKENDPNELLMYCMMRSDLNAPCGKLMAQAGHAFAHALLVAPGHIRDAYMVGITKKIVVALPDEPALNAWSAKLGSLNVKHHVITDVGLTIFQSPTRTCIGIGPMPRWQADELGITQLHLYR